MLALVWVLSAAYTAHYLDRGWIPHDEGFFAQTAERVLQGQLPHRDFDDRYTGGLTLLHSLAFRMLGIKLTSMRLVLFGFFLLWIPALFYVASRLCLAVHAAGALTLLGVAWSLPNYPAPVTSWYNLFFAVFGTATLLRYIEVRTRRWLFVAGLCGGLSILAQSVAGLYYVVGVFLFLIFREQNLAKERNQQPVTRRAYVYTALITGGLSWSLSPSSPT